MLDKIIHFSLNQRLLVLTVTGFLLVFGIVLVPQIPVNVFPPLSKPTVVIATESPGFAAEEVEKLVSIPIESVMNGAPGVEQVRSISKVGVSLVLVQFGWKTNIYVDRQIVTEKLQTIQGQLPPGMVPELTPISSVFGQILMLNVYSKSGKTSPMKLRTLADWIIKRRLMTVPGISMIQVIGGDVKQYQVLVNPVKLQFYGLPLAGVAEAARNTNENTTGGFLQTPDRQYVIRNIGRTDRIADIARGILAYRDDVPIEIGNVARVAIGPQVIKIGESVYGERTSGTMPQASYGKGSEATRPQRITRAVLLNVIRQPGVNTVDLVKEINGTLSNIQSSLPSDVGIAVVYNQSRFIKMAIRNVEEAAAEGGLIVAAVVILFLFNGQATFITLLSIPLSFIIAMLGMRHFGMSMNTMTLGGLAVAIGELIDDAIINVENVFRRLKENHHAENPRPALQVVYEASSEVRNAIVYATLVVVLVFVPIFFLPGMTGQLFRPVAVTYIVSLLASLVVSLTISPVLCYYLLPKAKAILRESESRVSVGLKRQYGKILEKVLNFPWPVLALAAVLFVAAAVTFPFMGKEFLPPFNEGSIMVQLTANPNTSVGEMGKIATLAEKLLLTIPEIRNVGAKIGRSELTADADPLYRAEIDAELHLSKRNIDAIQKEIRQKLSVIPGVSVELSQRIFENMNELLTGTAGQVVVKLFGPDLPVLVEKGGQIENVMAGTPGVVDLSMERQELVPELWIQVKRKEADRYGLSPGEVNNTLELALRGKEVSQVLEGIRTFDLFVGYDKPYRDSLRAVENTLIDLPGGAEIPVRSVASIRYVDGPNVILHDNGQRRIAIFCNVQGRPTGTVVTDIQKAVQEKVKLPPGYFVRYEGQFKEQQEATRLILFFSLMAVIGVFMILESHFHLSRISLQVMANIPLALIGGVAAIFLSGGILSVASLLGFITVSGIVTRNGIMMISHYLHLMENEGESFTREMVIRGAKERLVPILMTALAAALGVLPFALAKGQTGKEILQPLCVVILGGIVSATLLNLFVTPALFWLFGKPAWERIESSRVQG